MAKKIRVTQTRDGKTTSFLTKDKGKPGKTPKEKQWFRPSVHTGWEKDQPESERRTNVLNAHKGNELSAARSMQALSNVTTDKETRRLAREDAKYFFRIHREMPRRRFSSRKAVRITPKRPRLGR